MEIGEEKTNPTLTYGVECGTTGWLVECTRFMDCFTRRIPLLMTGRRLVCPVKGAFKSFSGLAFAFLDAARQFIHLALHALQVATRKSRKGLLQFALGYVPVSFGNECAHV